MSANKHLSRGCPAIMNDPRVLANWDPNSVIVGKLALANGFDPHSLDSNKFRAFLQQNANAIRDQENVHLRQVYSCPRPVKNVEIVRPYMQ